MSFRPTMSIDFPDHIIVHKRSFEILFFARKSLRYRGCRLKTLARGFFREKRQDAEKKGERTGSITEKKFYFLK